MHMQRFEWCSDVRFEDFYEQVVQIATPVFPKVFHSKCKITHTDIETRSPFARSMRFPAHRKRHELEELSLH